MVDMRDNEKLRMLEGACGHGRGLAATRGVRQARSTKQLLEHLLAINFLIRILYV